MVAAQIEGNFDKETVAVVDTTNQYLGSTKGVLIAKTFVVLGATRHCSPHECAITLKKATSLSRCCIFL